MLQAYSMSRSMMRLFFFFKKTLFFKPNLSYNPEVPQWKPESNRFFYCFLEASLICMELGLSEKEYLCAILESRRLYNNFNKIDEMWIHPDSSIDAIECYVFNDRFGVSKQGSQFLTFLKDPEEISRNYVENELGIWKGILGVSTSVEDALQKIFTTDLRNFFSESFFMNLEEFQTMRAHGLICKDSDGKLYYQSPS